ncbi:MAG TPA: 5'-3' exonuclease H3TH domain-containing protein [Candidatus Saccharimonadales bacterium]|nr:5'-3' exonuclease H3TH domain-containing protein [Candidatus Saccharimonadales bacterium]
MKRLLIIDGNAIVHRAYHALPPLTDKQGQPVNAVYGFFSMLLKVLDDVKPDYIIVCFDRPKPTFRKALFAGYQANRPKMAEDLSGQITTLHTALEKNNITIFERDGYEADDLIGTLAYQAVQHEHIEVKIVTGDRDLLQLVNHKVHILFPILGITKMTEYDEKAVEEKFGVTPKQFIDYKALIGDVSDGYPGVGGIGPKTAVGLLKKFDTFENIYQHLAEISPRVAEKLAKDTQQAALAKQLATILIDVPITLHMETCAVAHLEKETMADVFTDLSFESLRKRLESIQTIMSKKEKEKAKLGSQMSLL